jgi:tetratricopeptide (TPR) repeat protein
MRLRRQPDSQNAAPSKRAAAAELNKQQLPAGTAGGATKPQAPATGLARVWRDSGPQAWLGFALLSMATFICYTPCLNGQFVWDDDAWTLHLEKILRDASGLAAIWTNLTALQQYYPLTATTFWIDYQLWGFWTLPYHIENLLLHLFAALLFWKLLKRLEMRGAWWACAVLALHPMMVESVGWITERKNVLSLALFLAALLSYARFANDWQVEPNSIQTKAGDTRRKWPAYVAALILFLAAYLAKATAFSFPAVLLLICWWKRGRLKLVRDVAPTLPFFAIAIGLGGLTSWLERTHVGASGPDWNLSIAERCLIAGRALWFYVGKLLWPTELCFIYPRWQINAHAVSQWVWPVLAVVLIASLWLARERIGRGPVTAILFFVGSLFPLLGFMNGYFMRYSFVCDHWAYLPSLSLIALGAAAVTRLSNRLGLERAFSVSAALVLLAFGILTWRHSEIFADSETLYRRTLARNPEADLAHNNLGLLLFRAGEPDEAIMHFERALQIRPGSAHAHNNLANAYRVMGRPRQAAEHYEMSLKLEPGNANTWNNLALLRATCADASVRNGPRAVELAQHAEQITGGKNPILLATLAAAYAESGRFAEAVKAAETAQQLAGPNSGLAQALQAQIELYLKGVPYHDPGPVQPTEDR